MLRFARGWALESEEWAGDPERSQGKKRSVGTPEDEEAQTPEDVEWMEEMSGMVARVERVREGGVVVTRRMESEEDGEDERMAT